MVFLFIMLFCRVLLADSRELTGIWEREADGSIWGDYVLNPQNFTGIGHCLKLNTLCDHRAFEEIAAVRKEMLSTVRDTISTGGLSHVAELCGYVLEVYASIGIAPLSGEERILLSKLLLKKWPMNGDMRLIGGSRRGDGNLAVFEAAVNVNPSRRDSGRDYLHKSNNDRTSGLTGRVNLSIYSLRFNKVDYFSLIFYLWEDNPFDRIGNTTSRTRLNAILISLISHSLQNYLSGNKSKDSFNQDNKSETQSAVFRCVSLDYPHNRNPLPDSPDDSEMVFATILKSERFRGTRDSW